MRVTRIAAIGTLALVGAACGTALQVHTAVDPEFSPATLSTFRVLPAPPPRNGREVSGAYDPMVNNSIANRALRETITQTFVERGYTLNERAPDFAVAVYASAREKLDVTAWDYGYPFWPRRAWPYPYQREMITEYTEGTVIVDVIQPRTRELLWRGTASARLSEKPARDVRELQKVAREIVRKFPQAVERVVAMRR